MPVPEVFALMLYSLPCRLWVPTAMPTFKVIKDGAVQDTSQGFSRSSLEAVLKKLGAKRGAASATSASASVGTKDD